MPMLTETQRFVLKWIDEHGQFQREKHPDFWLHLRTSTGLSVKEAKRFNIHTLRILVDAGLLSSSDGFVTHYASYRITTLGRKMLQEPKS